MHVQRSWKYLEHSNYSCDKSLRSCLTLCDPMDYSLPGSSVVRFSRQDYWSGLPCPLPGECANPGIKPVSLMSSALAGGFFTTSTTIYKAINMNVGFPNSTSGKETTCSFNPWVGKIPYRRKWQSTPLFLPGKFHEQRSQAGYISWGHKELNATK